MHFPSVKFPGLKMCECIKNENIRYAKHASHVCSSDWIRLKRFSKEKWVKIKTFVLRLQQTDTTCTESFALTKAHRFSYLYVTILANYCVNLIYHEHDIIMPPACGKVIHL